MKQLDNRHVGLVPMQYNPMAGELREMHENGEGYTRYEVIAAPGMQAARKWVEQWRPARHCQHGHDCCGHYYPTAADVYRVGRERFVVVQRYYQNV